MRQKYPSKKILQHLNQKYGIKNILKISRFESGIENSNYLVKTKNQNYALKIFEETPSKSIKLELSYMEYCKNSSFPIQKIYKSKNGSQITHILEKPSVLLEYIHGKGLRHIKVTPNIIRNIARRIPEFDTKSSSFFYPNYSKRLHYWGILQFNINRKFLSLIKKDRKTVAQCFADFESIKPLFKKCRKGFIHNDFNIENILFKKEKITGVIDFGDSANTLIINDLVVALAQICFAKPNSMRNAGILYRKYIKNYPLLKTEKNIIYELLKIRFATCILRPNYMEKKYSRFSPAFNYYINLGYRGLTLLNKLGKKEFNKSLGITND